MLRIKLVKTSYGQIKKLNTARAAYIAGIIDGEGTISLIRIAQKEQRRLRVSISNGDIKLLEWVRKAIGAGQITQKKPTHPEHSLSFAYKICGRQAFNLLIQIYPYLKTENKRGRTKLILKNYIKLTPRNGKYTSKLLRKREEFLKKFFSVPLPGTDKLNPRKSPFIENILQNN